MKRVVKASTEYNTISKLEELADNMLYQVFDNYPEFTLEEAIDRTLDDVVWVITDDELDGENRYTDVLNFYKSNERKFEKIVRDYVENHYEDLPWSRLKYSGLYDD